MSLDGYINGIGHIYEEVTILQEMTTDTAWLYKRWVSTA